MAGAGEDGPWTIIRARLRAQIIAHAGAFASVNSITFDLSGLLTCLDRDLLMSSEALTAILSRKQVDCSR